MKETIGEKIKRLRKEMGLTQDYVHNNQSQISQIESGRITNPDENTLLLIAKKMEIPFDELISDTTWVKPESASIGKEITFSPAAFDIEVDDMLNITWSQKSYPLYNDNGEKNEYCIYTGEKLIDKCKECGRSVTNVKQMFCSGCGKNFVYVLCINEDLERIISSRETLSDYYACGDVIEFLVRKKGIYESILYDLKTLINTDIKSEKERLIKIYSKSPKGGSTLGYIVDNMYRNIADLLQDGHEIKMEHIYDLDFDVQTFNAVIKKLKYLHRNMDPALSQDSPEYEADEIKTLLMRKVAQRVSDYLDGNVYTPEMLMGMLKDLSTTDGSDELIEKLQSKIDLNTESDEDSNDEEISEDGNSETAAEDDTEQANDNAENEDDKESEND